MEKKHQFQGLTEAEVLKSRAQHGVNILTPPEKEYSNILSTSSLLISTITSANIFTLTYKTKYAHQKRWTYFS